MSENGARKASALRAQLAKVERSREQIAKAWVVEVILNSNLSEVKELPLGWASEELPQLVSDILSALGSENQALDTAVQRAARLAQERGASTSPAQLTREMAYLHSSILATMRMEMAASEPDLFAEAVERLAALFTRITGYTVEVLTQRSGGANPATGLVNGGQMRSRVEQMVALTKRYGSPFALLILDIEGPGSRDTRQAMGIVSHAVRGSIRLMDEAYSTEQDGICVLAPHQTAESAAQMANRLTQILARLDRASDLRIRISTGIVACPEHGEDPSRLLHAADTAMWRARATGRGITVAGLQDR
jgi:diguanylate cyclase (GGDEF)-like protein